jgi:amino acid transporter
MPEMHRRLGVLNATSINMSNMIGTGPFITIAGADGILASMQGPQALIGWLVGAVIALADGLVVSELGAALPASGGNVVFLREGFGRGRWGRMMAFLFVWQFLFSGPLEIASGNIGIIQYLGYFWPGMTPLQTKLGAAAIGAIALYALYRRITDVAKLMLALWITTLVTTGWVILAGLTHFNRAIAFDLPPNAFQFGLGFVRGLGAGTLVVMYNYLGYYQVSYLGAEVKQPARTIPYAVVISIFAVAVINILISLSFIGVVPWREAIQMNAIGSVFMERLYGKWAASALTVMIVVTAFSSVYALMLGYSRIPYAAAHDGIFFRGLGVLHPKGEFPHRSLLLVGALVIVASFFSLGAVISALMTARILVEFLGRVVAAVLIRAKRPDIQRPFRMWLYPVPAILSFAGYTYVFLASGAQFILYGLITLAAGVLIYVVASRKPGKLPV